MYSKHIFTVNQQHYLQLQQKHNIKLDVIDLCIFNIYISFKSFKSVKKLVDIHNNIYILVNYKMFTGNPILGINSRTAILKRINNLVLSKFIVAHPGNCKGKLTYYRVGELGQEYLGEDQTCRERVQLNTKHVTNAYNLPPKNSVLLQKNDKKVRADDIIYINTNNINNNTNNIIKKINKKKEKTGVYVVLSKF